MKIQINNKLIEIKTAANLTVNEYCELQGRITNEMGNIDLLIEYISVVTGLQASKVLRLNIDEKTILRLINYIGVIQETFEQSNQFYYKKQVRTIYAKTLNWRTMGVRAMMENNEEENPYKLMVYQLALYLSGDYDNEKVTEIHEDLQSCNAIEVFSFISFFLFSSKITGKSGTNSFQNLLRKVGISIAI